MKLNLDCMRAIMLQIEDLPFQKEISFNKLCEQLPKYSKDELSYTCIKLKEANLINALIINADNFTQVYSLNDLTYDGHQFLADIRSDSIWNKTKSVLSELGSTSVSAAIQVAASIVQSLIAGKINL